MLTPSSRFFLPALGVGCLLLTACGHEWEPAGTERTDTVNIEMDQSQEVRVDLKMGAGELKVRGGADKLMEGRFTYSRLRMRPKVSYNGGGFRGHLLVEEPSGMHGGSKRYAWDLLLNDNKPLDLEVNCGAGESHLDLGDLALRRVNINMGVGELKMDLRGTPKNDYSVSVNGGVGEAIIYLPRDVGIEANVQGGIGDIHAPGLMKRNRRYVNEAYGHSRITVSLDVRGGIGSIDLVAN